MGSCMSKICFLRTMLHSNLTSLSQDFAPILALLYFLKLSHNMCSDGIRNVHGRIATGSYIYIPMSNYFVPDMILFNWGRKGVDVREEALGGSLEIAI